MYEERPKSNSELYRKIHSGRKRVPKFMVDCHFCGNEWSSKLRCFVCPKCHTPYIPPAKRTYLPTKSIAEGFGAEVRAARIRVNITIKELATLMECHSDTIKRIERGGTNSRDASGKIIRERVRIWVESTKSPIDKRNEIDEMFKETANG